MKTLTSLEVHTAELTLPQSEAYAFALASLCQLYRANPAEVEVALEPGFLVLTLPQMRNSDLGTCIVWRLARAPELTPQGALHLEVGLLYRKIYPAPPPVAWHNAIVHPARLELLD